MIGINVKEREFWKDEEEECMCYILETSIVFFSTMYMGFPFFILGGHDYIFQKNTTTLTLLVQRKEKMQFFYAHFFKSISNLEILSYTTRRMSACVFRNFDCTYWKLVVFEVKIFLGELRFLLWPTKTIWWSLCTWFLFVKLSKRFLQSVLVVTTTTQDFLRNFFMVFSSCLPYQPLPQIILSWSQILNRPMQFTGV